MAPRLTKACHAACDAVVAAGGRDHGHASRQACGGALMRVNTGREPI